MWILLLAICEASSFLTLFFIFVTAPNIFSENQYQQLNICEPAIIAQYSQSNSHAGSLNKKEKQEQLSAIWSQCADPEQPFLYRVEHSIPVNTGLSAQYSPLNLTTPSQQQREEKGNHTKFPFRNFSCAEGSLKIGLNF